MTNASPDAAPGEVRLRAVQDADLPILFEQQLDPVATQMAAFPSRDHQAFMAHWARVRADPTNILLTILYDGQVAGNLGCWEQDGARVVGYWLGRPYWGRGIATRALAAFLAQMPTRPVVAYVVRHNVASQRVLEKCGFTRCETDPLAPPAAEHDEEVKLILRAHDPAIAS